MASEWPRDRHSAAETRVRATNSHINGDFERILTKKIQNFATPGAISCRGRTASAMTAAIKDVTIPLDVGSVY